MESQFCWHHGHITLYGPQFWETNAADQTGKKSFCRYGQYWNQLDQEKKETEHKQKVQEAKNKEKKKKKLEQEKEKENKACEHNKKNLEAIKEKEQGTFVH